MSKILCIYHGNCADGFGAAWVIRKALGAERVDFHAGVYQNAPPDARGRPVVMVDFSFRREALLGLASRSDGVLLLDHHKSAVEDLTADNNYIVDLGAYTGPITWEPFCDNAFQDRCENAPYGRVYTMFDMARSGAGLAWDFFFPGQPRPRLVDHIEDRDLWRFLLPHTREIQAAVFSYPYDFTVWDELFSADLELMAKQGEAIERKHHKDIAELVGVTKRRMVIGGFSVPVANLPYTLTSDAGNLMAAGEPFAACYWDTPDGRVFSLRSREDGADVSAIAKSYGGGGHRNASGFRMPIGWEGDSQ